MITLGKNFRLDNDDRCYILQERKIVKNGENKGAERWENVCYPITKQNGRNDTRKSIDFAFWNGEAFGRERKCNIGVSGVLAWRELPEPWEGEK